MSPEGPLPPESKTPADAGGQLGSEDARPDAFLPTLARPGDPELPLPSSEAARSGVAAPPSPEGSRPPHPGFGFAVLWCIAFLIVTYGVAIGAAIVILGAQAAFSGDPQGFLNTLVEFEEDAGQKEGQEQAPPAHKPLTQTPRLKLSRPFANAVGAALFLAEAASIAFALLVIRLAVGRDWKRQLALRRPAIGHVVLVVLSLPAFLILPGAVKELAEKVLPTFGDNTRAMQDLLRHWPWWFGVMAIGLGPGLGEELWCRGFVGRGLVARYGWVVGVVLTSLLFGVMHVDPTHAAATAFMGVWLHIVYLTSRSLWLPILLHTLNNSVAVLSVHVSDLGALDKEASEIPLGVFAAAAILLGVIGWALYRGRARVVLSSADPGAPWRPAFPGAGYPPPETGTVVVRPGAGWLAWGAVFAAAALFTGVFYLVASGHLVR